MTNALQQALLAQAMPIAAGERAYGKSARAAIRTGDLTTTG
jgi:hypothetical protein